MVIEHSFVTVMPPEQALGLASELLARGGFVAERDAAFDLAGGGRWTTLQVRRGRKSVARAKDPTQSPQTVRLEWDRGRVTVAASIDVPATRNRGFFYGGLVGMAIAAGTTGKMNKRTKRYGDLMVTISQEVDDLLVGRVAPAEAGQRWFAMDQMLKATAAKARRRSMIVVGVIVAVVFALYHLAVVNLIRH